MRVAQAPTKEGDIHHLSLKQRAGLSAGGVPIGAAAATIAVVGKKIKVNVEQLRSPHKQSIEIGKEVN